MRGGVLGASVSDIRGTGTKLGSAGANPGTAERSSAKPANGEADLQPKDAIGAPESTNRQTAFRPKGASGPAKSTNGQAAFRPESTIGDTKSANRETSLR